MLLIDGFVDEANRDYRVKLMYKMPVKPALSIDAQYSHIPDIYNHPGSTAELSKNHFLRHTAAVINSAEVSVADIIRLAANSLGVHHFGGSGEKRAGQDLFRFYEGFSVRNAPCLIQLMTQILAVVLDALRPLIERIAPVPIDGDHINA
ncbi:MAG TPA: hypothetical protein PLL33_07740 [Paracoccus sp. (in: a-proteobacteria)]|nr:hypothetical protein [Paracoccus sp. (in: a-proteobacteria)]